jgi:hypothetical protein
VSPAYVLTTLIRYHSSGKVKIGHSIRVTRTIGTFFCVPAICGSHASRMTHFPILIGVRDCFVAPNTFAQSTAPRKDRREEASLYRGHLSTGDPTVFIIFCGSHASLVTPIQSFLGVTCSGQQSNIVLIMVYTSINFTNKGG